MRITNKIMQRNNLSNINTNKIYQDKLSTQMSTQKKINRPSDDPVVAIRALRLRSNVTEITQYYSKNIPDAESWLSVTEDALSNLSQILTDMISQCTKGSNGDLTTDDRKIILEQLKALSDEVYTTGDADYAGRYVFTGYRTDTPLAFQNAMTMTYSITEQLDASAIDTVTMVNTDKLLDINTGNYMNVNVEEQDVSSVQAYRIRLAYNDCSEYDGATTSPKIEYYDENGALQTWSGFETTNPDGSVTGDIKLMHSYEDPYTYISNPDNADAVVYVPETGELLLGANKYETLMSTRDDEATVLNESEIRITYEKNDWVKGDLRPEHYFYCEAGDVTYNESYLEPDTAHQIIEYDVGFNQTIQVNSTADEAFVHGIGREVDDLVSAVQNVADLEVVKANIEDMLELVDADSAEGKQLRKQLDAVDKALTLAKDKEQKLFEKGISSFQKYLDQTNLSITDVGTRSSKLELIKNRMQSQKTTFETLKSENEDVDITEVAINLSSAELTYEAALMATGKVMQTTLLNYI